MSDEIKSVIAEASFPIPPDGEKFELTINGDEVDPMEMVKADGYKNPRIWEFGGGPSKWEYNCRRVEGIQTTHFKLVRAHKYQLSVQDVNEELGKHGGLALGQWRESFRKKYHPDGKGPIGFAGSTWVDPHGDLLFPYLVDGGGVWRSDFHWVGKTGQGVILTTALMSTGVGLFGSGRASNH